MRKWSASFGCNRRDALPGHPVHILHPWCFPQCMAGGREIASTKPQEPAVMRARARQRRRAAPIQLGGHASSLRRRVVYVTSPLPSLSLSREPSSSILRNHHARSLSLSPFLSPHGICFSDGANFRRYGSIGGARSRRSLGRSFGISCRLRGFCLVNEETEKHVSRKMPIEYNTQDATSLHEIFNASSFYSR